MQIRLLFEINSFQIMTKHKLNLLPPNLSVRHLFQPFIIKRMNKKRMDMLQQMY